jgi:hypothetical protein
VILVIPNAQTPINQLIEHDIDSLHLATGSLSKDLFVVRDAPKIEFKRFDTLLPSIKEQIEKEHYALLVDCRSVESSDSSTDIYVAYIKQTYDFMIDEVVWVATHVCDLAVELINQRLEMSLNNFFIEHSIPAARLEHPRLQVS